MSCTLWKAMPFLRLFFKPWYINLIKQPTVVILKQRILPLGNCHRIQYCPTAQFTVQTPHSLNELRINKKSPTETTTNWGWWTGLEQQRCAESPSRLYVPLAVSHYYWLFEDLSQTSINQSVPPRAMCDTQLDSWLHASLLRLTVCKLPTYHRSETG